ncbi:MAG: cysteine desulfurase family protein [Candidatus Thorarchaeota archaeon]
MPNLYFDYHSSKPTDPRVVDAMIPFFTEKIGNPSSLHRVGDEATEALEASRKNIADYIHAEPDEIVFTSGATESNNLALIGYALRNKKKGSHVIISEVEHISIMNLAKSLTSMGFQVTRVPVDQYGMVLLDKLERRIRNDTILISVGYASNEIGTIQPIREIGKIAAERGIAFHTDAVAAQGLLELDVRRDNINLMTLSSNDFYGPKGLGILYMQKGYRVNPIIIGGGQERGIRSGTENIPAIVGMSVAVDILRKEMESEVRRFRAYHRRITESVLSQVPYSYLNGHPEQRLASNSHFRFDGIEGEAILLSLKDKGISVSTGSACTSKTLEPSHTLIATGLIHEEAHGSLQITTGRFNRDDEIDILIEAIPEVISRLRSLSPIYLQRRVKTR